MPLWMMRWRCLRRMFAWGGLALLFTLFWQPATGAAEYVAHSDSAVAGTQSNGSLDATYTLDGAAQKLAEAKDSGGQYRLEWHWHFMVAALMLTGLVACGSATVGGGYNPTTPTNVFEERLFDQLDSNIVVIASVNLGGPSRNYLKKRESFVDSRVQEYLEDAGYEVRPQREFSQRWNNAVLIYGDPIDPTTGRVNQKSFIQIVQAVRDLRRRRPRIEVLADGTGRNGHGR